MEAPQLIGREPELARLESLIDSGGQLMLRGPRGCGVSALVDAAAAMAAARGWRVLRATGVQWESGFPYAGLHQLLRPLRRSLGDRPALRAALGQTDEPPPPPAAVAAELGSLVEQHVFACVDEWQWIDAETRAILTGFAPLLVGGHERGPFPELPVYPLDPVSAARLIAADVPLLVRERVLRDAAGRPLALIELPAAFAAAGDGDLLGSWAPLTPALEEAFAAGVERLDDVTAAAVLVAALDDGNHVPAVLAAASRLTGHPLERSVLAPAVALGLLELDGDTLRWAHPLTRAAIRRRADPAARVAGHEAFAAIATGDRATWHRAVAAPGLDAALAGEMEAVSHRTRDRGDYERSTAALRRAARLTPPGPDRDRRFAAAAELAHEIGGVDLADRLLHEAGDHGGALIRARNPDALLAAAATTDDPERAARLRWRAATELQAVGGDGAAIAAGTGGEIAGGDGDAEGGDLGEAEGGDPVGVGGEAAGGDPVGVGGEAAGGDSVGVGGEAAGGDPVGVGGEATPVGAGAQRSATDFALRGFHALVTADARGAAPLFDAAVHLLRAQRRRLLLGQVLALSAWAQIASSDLGRAGEDAEEAAWINAHLGQHLWAAAAGAALATVAALRGDAEETERHAAEAEKVALPARGSYVLACVQQARGALALGAGRPEEAFAHLRRTFDPTDPACATVAFSILLEDLAESATAPEEQAFARHALAKAKPGQGARFAAFILDEDATPPALDAPFLKARVLLTHGMRLRRRRRVADSREPLRAAVAGFEAFGSHMWAERARRELAATAESTHNRDLDRLTPQELEIAKMAARGMTNPAIAADLALSPRTVGHHLTKIFPKLEVSSRAGIAQALENLGYE